MSRKLRFEYPGALYHIINLEGSHCVSSETRQLCHNGWIAEALQIGSESAVSKLAKRVTNGEFDAATGLLELLNSRIKE